jgi:uncharacterized protein with von Willebrand factor type A (vWA) domain
LRHKEFSELTGNDLAVLAALVRHLRIAMPVRRCRRTPPGRLGNRVDRRRAWPDCDAAAPTGSTNSSQH